MNYEYKKSVYSRKKSIRTLIIFIIVQLLFIMAFVRVFNESKPIDVEITKQADITVDDIFCFRAISEYKLVVCSNTEKYWFSSRSTFEEYSVHELEKTLTVGDELSIIYYDGYNIYGKIKKVVDARTETEIYRCFSEYNKGKEGAILGWSVVFL